MADLSRISWWDWLPLPWRKWRVVLRVDAGDQIPERIPRGGAVLVAPEESPTWIAFDCPCRQHHRVMLNLERQRHPYWTVDTIRPLSISPSIDDVTRDRRCHFFVKDGKIRWVPNRERRKYEQ